jgi:hypothetical protein
MDPREVSIQTVARDKARRKIGERMIRTAADRLSYVLPLLSFEKTNKPFVASCAVKVLIGTQRWLFTAAHVVDLLNQQDLWFATAGNEWSNVTGESNRTDPPQGRPREEDRIDAAVIRLSEPSASLIPGPFLSLKGMDINDPYVFKTKYLILGYPGSRTKKNFMDRKVTPRSLQYVGSNVSLDKYVAAGVFPYAHVAMDFDRENVIGNVGLTTAPHPSGMSGCGVWRFDSLMKPGSIGRDKLVGIFTEHPPDHSNLLIATRVSVHAEILIHHWPEFATAIPKRRLVKFNAKSAVPLASDA